MKLDPDKIDWSEIPEIYTYKELTDRMVKLEYLSILFGSATTANRVRKEGSLPPLKINS